jgi:diguanylate cyclase (GGDEF)-like protein/PAS domain S-box-containing protein/excisionase family DNA binding protein
MAENEYSIQEAAELLGVPIPKLRRWDKQGVLVAVRTDGGHRRYPKDLVDQIARSGTGDGAISQELASVKRSLAEKHRIIQLLAESEGRYRDLVETSHDLIWATDAQGSFTYLNGAANDVFGMAPKDLLGRCFFDFEVNDAHISNRRFLALLKRHGEVKHHVTHLRTQNNEDRWIGINARVTTNDRGEIRGIRGTARDITEEQRALRRIEHLALHDTLTDLPNRHAMQRGIELAMEAGSLGALLFLDIDHFKYINDNFGHRIGDKIITGVGSALREAVRAVKGDLYRIGGDEFAIHMPNALRKEAIESAEHVLTAIRHYQLQVENGKVIANLSASIGIALYPFHGGDLPSLLSNVDIAMYQAKDMGRNRYTLFDQDSGALRNTHKRVHWAKKLRDALDEDRLVLFAQPVVRLSDRQVMHHEVLLRILDDNGSIVGPANFIEIAETLGTIQEIDLRVVEKVLEYIDHNGLAGKKTRYFVNLSRVSISNQDWVDRFMKLLSNSRAQPNQLVLEITETAALSEIDVTLKFIRRLKEMGCRFALDDFGAGFSSFYYLKQFDVDYLKIDGSFVRDLISDSGSRLFVKALNDVAHGLNKQVIAEWVEEPEVRDLLIQMGTQYGQGFLFQKPQPLVNETRNVPRIYRGPIVAER